MFPSTRAHPLRKSSNPRFRPHHLLHPLLPPLPPNRVRQRGKAHSRMTHRQCQHRNHNHHALQHNVFAFDAHEGATPAACELGDAVHTADEYGDVCDSGGSAEELEAAIVAPQ